MIPYYEGMIGGIGIVANMISACTGVESFGEAGRWKTLSFRRHRQGTIIESLNSFDIRNFVGPEKCNNKFDDPLQTDK